MLSAGVGVTSGGMVSTASVRCPACGTRNELTWEVCAQCGESLAEVAVSPGGEGARPPARARPGRGGAGFRFPVRTVLQVPARRRLRLVLRRVFDASDPAVGPHPTRSRSARCPRPPRPPPAPPVAAWEESFNQGRRLLLQGRAAEALEYLAEAVPPRPRTNLSITSYYGKALWQTGARDEALRRVRHRPALNPAAVEYRRDRARAYVALNRRADAESYYTRALQEQPDAVESLQGLAWLTTERGDGAAAVGLLQRAVQLRPADPALVQYLAYALEKSGQFAEAEHYYASVLSDVPDARHALPPGGDVLRPDRRTRAYGCSSRASTGRPSRRCCSAPSAVCSSARGRSRMRSPPTAPTPGSPRTPRTPRFSPPGRAALERRLASGS